MKNLAGKLGWLHDLTNGAILGTAGGVVLASTYDAIQAQSNFCFWFIGLALSALSAAWQIDF